MSCGLNTTCGPVCSIIPPAGCTGYTCSDATVRSQFLSITKGDSWISAQPIVNSTSSSTSYQVVPFWVDNSKSIGISHLPALSLYYDTTTLRILLRIDGTCSGCTTDNNVPRANSGLGPYVLACTYDLTTKQYGPLTFLSQGKISCTMVSTWALINAPGGGTNDYYIQPIYLACRGGYYCLDTNTTLQRDSKTNVATLATGLESVTLNVTGSQLPRDNFRMNIYTYNALQILNFLQPLS
jgi:hypothetical protein